ncbi:MULTISPECIES: TlpA family protein disulfide reductase [Flammeovirga]|uniref:TlpA family protein disulfide reductase n=1 Tax=Flammeovirga agarivorans TaxID=2726742 RepID=A0A7X8XVK3_9BACT|nr:MULTISPECIES: TlpA disulfide reductase family protein [Flammeovirga]NLR91145.1 TlpA family protein disulfide reductase [Flammeovirga agarivorans]
MKNKLFSILALIISVTLFSFTNTPKGDGDKESLYVFKDLEGNTVDLTEFEGKYVYIDVWASWCGPCLREIPSLQEIEKKYEGKDIVFVSLSVDQSTDAWKAMVKKKDLHGNQLHLGTNFKFTDKFNITSIPRFILLDKKGKVENANAPRPSEEALVALFKDLGL